jgi:hypothetical protein
MRQYKKKLLRCNVCKQSFGIIICCFITAKNVGLKIFILILDSYLSFTNFNFILAITAICFRTKPLHTWLGVKIFIKKLLIALAVWRSGHRIRLRNKKTRVQIPTGYEVYRET